MTKQIPEQLLGIDYITRFTTWAFQDKDKEESMTIFVHAVSTDVSGHVFNFSTRVTYPDVEAWNLLFHIARVPHEDLCVIDDIPVRFPSTPIILTYSRNDGPIHRVQITAVVEERTTRFHGDGDVAMIVRVEGDSYDAVDTLVNHLGTDNIVTAPMT